MLFEVADIAHDSSCECEQRGSLWHVHGCASWWFCAQSCGCGCGAAMIYQRHSASQCALLSAGGGLAMVKSLSRHPSSASSHRSSKSVRKSYWKGARKPGNSRASVSALSESGSSHTIRGPACRFCLRARNHPNPRPSTVPGPFLKFIAEDRAECSSCKAFITSFFKGQKKATIEAGLKNDPKKREKYKDGVETYEEQMESGGHARRTKAMASDIEVPQFLALAQECASKSKMICGIFWPKDVYARVEGKELSPDEIQPHTHNGVKYWGIVREPSCGVYAGCIELTEEDNLVLTRGHELEQSGTAPEAIEKTHALVQKNMRASVKRSASKDDLEPTIQVKRLRSLHKTNSDSSADDWLKAVNARSTPTKAKRSRADTDVDEDDADSRPRKASKTTQKKPTPKRQVAKPSPSASGARAQSSRHSDQAPVYRSQQQRELIAAKQTVSDVSFFWRALRTTKISWR